VVRFGRQLSRVVRLRVPELLHGQRAGQCRGPLQHDPRREQHVDFVADTIAFLDERGLASIEPDEQAEKAWWAHVNDVAEQSVYPKANTWYMGDNVPGKPREFLAYAGGGPAYFDHFKKAVADEYRSFVLRERQ
jgi:hypothetical protein